MVEERDPHRLMSGQREVALGGRLAELREGFLTEEALVHHGIDYDGARLTLASLFARPGSGDGKRSLARSCWATHA